MKNFKEGRSYLVKSKWIIIKITIIEITKTSVKFERESGGKEWKTISEFENDYLFVEDLNEL